VAYLVSLDVACRGGCSRRATKLLRNERGEVVAQYCDKCGEMARAKLQGVEDRTRLLHGRPPPLEPEG
jgi:hypothetical protein